MKVLVIGFSNLRYMPYLYKYTEIMDETDVEYDIVYWDRDGLNDLPTDERFFCFKFIADLNKSKFKKVKEFLLFREYVQKILSKKTYDKLIVLTTIPGILLVDVLMKKYKKNYILDFRDLTHEYLWFYRMMVNRLAHNSWRVMISSEGFKRFLPQKINYISSHNIQTKIAAEVAGSRTGKVDSGKLRIVFYGIVRQVEFNCRLVNCFGNDDRFEIFYRGRGGSDVDKLKIYCENQGYSNVYFTGIYLPDQKSNILNEANLINNIYENDWSMSYATANKFYDGCVHKVPQLVNRDSHMAELVERYQIGMVIEPDKAEVANAIFEWYQNIDWEQFDLNCTKVLEEVYKDEAVFKEEVRNYLKQRAESN